MEALINTYANQIQLLALRNQELLSERLSYENGSNRTTESSGSMTTGGSAHRK